MSQSPQEATGSRSYKEGWRAVNELIRGGGSWSGRERNVAYRNLGNGKFEDVSYVAGLDFPGDGRAFAAFDYDHDGRMDLALSFRTGPRLRLLKNQQEGGAKAVVLELRGVRGNRDAVGAWVTLRTGGRVMHRQVRAGSGFLSQSSRRLHFGLTAGERVAGLEVRWPTGVVERWDGEIGPGLHRVTEGGGVEALAARATVVAPEREAVAESLWLAEAVPAPVEVKLAGKWTLVSFYGEWCPPCRAEMAEWKGKGLPLVVVDVDKAPMAAWNTFRKLLFDYREELALPTSFLLDERGRVAKVYRGVTAAAAIQADLRAGVRPVLPFAGTWLGGVGKRNYGELAAAMAEAGLLAEAGKYFALAAPDEEMRVNYAASLLEQKQVAAARVILTDVLQRNGRQAEALANLGLLALGEEKWDEAAGLLERLRAVQKGDGAAAEWLGMARMGQGRLGEAAGLLEEARVLGRESGDLVNHLAILYAETGRKKEAEALFRYGVEKYPGHAGLKGNLERLQK